MLNSNFRIFLILIAYLVGRRGFLGKSAKEGDLAALQSKEQHYKFWEGIYYNEEKRRDGLVSTSSFLLGIIGFLVALLAFYVKDVLDWLPYSQFNSIICSFWVWAYFLALGADVLFISLGIRSLILSFHDYETRYLAAPGKIEEYYVKLLAFHTDRKTADEVFRAWLAEQYVGASNWNDENNIKRRKRIHWCTKMSIFALVSLAFTFIPFLFYKVNHPKKRPMPVQLENKVIFSMDEGSRDSGIDNGGLPKDNSERFNSGNEQTLDASTFHKGFFQFQAEEQITILAIEAGKFMTEPNSTPATPQAPTPPEPPEPRYIKEGSDESSPRPETSREED